MKHKKDIFELFRKGEHKLRERPSDRAWHRLENRLDRRRRRITPAARMRTWLSMAGVLVLLIGLISIISLFLTDRPQNMAVAEADIRPQFVLEEIGIYNDQKDIVYNVSAYQKQLNRLNTNPILEGDPSKELRVQKKVYIGIKQNANPIASAATSNAGKVDELTGDDRSSKPKFKQIQSNARAAQKEAPTTSVASSTAATTDNEIVDAGSDFSIAMPDDIAAEDIVTEEDVVDDKLDEAHVTAYGVPTPSRAELESKPQMNLSELKWLLGKWEAPADPATEVSKVTIVSAESKRKKQKKSKAAAKKDRSNQAPVQRSVEEWKQVSALALEGNGYVADRNRYNLHRTDAHRTSRR